MSVRIQVLECEIHGPTSEFYLGLCSGSEPRSHLKKNGVQTGTIPSFVRVFFFSFLFLSSLLGYLEKGGKKKELKNKRDISGNLRAAPLEEKFKECYLRWPTNALVWCVDPPWLPDFDVPFGCCVFWFFFCLAFYFNKLYHSKKKKSEEIHDILWSCIEHHYK